MGKVSRESPIGSAKEPHDGVPRDAQASHGQRQRRFWTSDEPLCPLLEYTKIIVYGYTKCIRLRVSIAATSNGIVDSPDNKGEICRHLDPPHTSARDANTVQSVIDIFN